MKLFPSPRTQNFPWLASDIVRGVCTILFAVVVSPIVMLVADHLWPMTDELDTLSFYALASWAVYNLGYVLLTHWVFWRADGPTFERWILASTARGRLQGWRWVIAGGGGVSWAVSSSFLALVGLTIVSLAIDGPESIVIRGAGLVMVASCWVASVTAFALQYARDYVTRGGLRFIETEHITWHDVGYLALQVHTTFSSSDVDLSSTYMRRMVSRQTLIAFVFNTVIVAMMVSLLQK